MSVVIDGKTLLTYADYVHCLKERIEFRGRAGVAVNLEKVW